MCVWGGGGGGCKNIDCLSYSILVDLPFNMLQLDIFSRAQRPVVHFQRAAMSLFLIFIICSTIW